MKIYEPNAPKAAERLTLKNVKVAAFLSRETTAFTATLYVDGKRTATAENDGQGGMTFVHPVDTNGAKTRLAAAEEFALSLMDPDDEYPVERGETALEIVIDELLGYAEEIKWLKRNSRKNTLFRTPDLPRGEWRSLNAPLSRVGTEYMEKNYPDAEVVDPKALS